MKNVIITIVFLAGGLVSSAQFTKASLLASGLTCSMCSKAVKVALEAVPFIHTVNVDIKSQVYLIEFKKDVSQDFDELKKAVEDAGFSVASLKLSGDFSGLKVEKDKHIRIGGHYFHFVKNNGQVLNGEQTVTIVDKDFLSSKEYKKYSSLSGLECVKTGKASSCCEKDGVPPSARVYHIII